MKEKHSIFEIFHNENVRIWLKNGGNYFGTLRIVKGAESCTISRDGNPNEVHALIKATEVIRIEKLFSRRDYFSAKED